MSANSATGSSSGQTGPLRTRRANTFGDRWTLIVCPYRGTLLSSTPPLGQSRCNSDLFVALVRKLLCGRAEFRNSAARERRDVAVDHNRIGRNKLPLGPAERLTDRIGLELVSLPVHDLHR